MMHKKAWLILISSGLLYAGHTGKQINTIKNQGSSMVNIGLNNEARKDMSDRLNILLSNEYVLYTKTLKFHWNVKGKLFGPLHKFFGDQYESLQQVVDDVAERIRSLGFTPYGTLQEFSSHATIPEEPGVNPNDTEMIQRLLYDYEAIIQQLRADVDFSVEINDMGSNNFLAGLLEKHEKTAWMLRAHLE